jgi:hypothetical protein
MKLMQSKGSQSLKRLQAARIPSRKAELILSTEINFTNSSDKGEEYFLLLLNPSVLEDQVSKIILQKNQ